MEAIAMVEIPTDILSYSLGLREGAASGGNQADTQTQSVLDTSYLDGKCLALSNLKKLLGRNILGRSIIPL
jgi:hypothetical protein